MSGHLTVKNRYQKSHSTSSRDAIRCQSCRASFCRNYSYSYTRREGKIVYNWNTKGYDPNSPHPTYGRFCPARGAPAEKEHLTNDRSQNAQSDNAGELRSDINGKGKATLRKTVGIRHAEDSPINLNERIDTWLQAADSSQSMGRECHKYNPPISETSSASNFEFSLSDSNNADYGSTNGKEDNGLDTGTYIHLGNSTLPCEFARYDACEQVFSIDSVDDWIEHIVSDHLRGKLPAKSVCWFCDEFIFYSIRNCDPRTSFIHRMWHIRSHILESRGSQNIRPDYYLLDHAYRCKLISTDVYNKTRRYSEVPRPAHVRSFDFISPEAEINQDLSNRIIVDQAKEDRTRRRLVPRSYEQPLQHGRKEDYLSYRCACGRTFSRLDIIKRHIASKHKVPNPPAPLSLLISGHLIVWGTLTYTLGL
ncbi:hypothetical protein F5Y09DRAFT_145891 [Xylaria sp. FL1042]|nr:hypothetical protein F5Y09DRAFT_145891 [Xylaria sp. FL1042]